MPWPPSGARASRHPTLVVLPPVSSTTSSLAGALLPRPVPQAAASFCNVRRLPWSCLQPPVSAVSSRTSPEPHGGRPPASPRISPGMPFRARICTSLRSPSSRTRPSPPSTSPEIPRQAAGQFHGERAPDPLPSLPCVHVDHDHALLGPLAPQPSLHPHRPSGPCPDTLRSVRIRSTTRIRLLHGFGLLPSRISGHMGTPEGVPD